MARIAHRPFAKIIAKLPDELIKPLLEFPGMLKLIDIDSIGDKELRLAFRRRAESVSHHLQNTDKRSRVCRAQFKGE